MLKRVWCKSNERYNIKCLNPTIKNSNSIMIWGCIYKDQVGPLVVVDGNLNAKKYIKLLKKNLLPILKDEEFSDFSF